MQKFTIRISWTEQWYNYLVELLSDGGADDPGVKSCNIDGNQRRKRFGSPIRIDHVPENRSFPLGVDIIGVLPP